MAPYYATTRKLQHNLMQFHSDTTAHSGATDRCAGTPTQAADLREPLK